MAIANFQIWNPNNTNQENDSAYTADALRSGGIPSGAIFPSPTANKLFYQISVFVAEFAQMLLAKGYNCVDSPPSNLLATLQNILTNADIAGKLVQFSDFTSGNNANGYWVRDPLGHIRQWGAINTDINNGQLAISFPRAFTNASSLSVVATTRGAASFDRIIYIINGSVTINGFTVANNGSGGFGYWMAEGY
jgi:hypothetical protein